MRLFFTMCALLLWPFSAFAQSAPAEPVTVEHYYRIKWGSAGEFSRLYKANHQPLLDEMKRQGFIVAMRTDEPFTHMAGNPRWDLRVTITYRDAPSAVVVGGAWDKAFAPRRRGSTRTRRSSTPRRRAASACSTSIGT